MAGLGHSCHLASTKAELKNRSGLNGWVLLPQQFAESDLLSMLIPHETVTSPLGMFWDVDIPRGRGTNRRVKGELRDRVLA
jgi:hypothetical protein